MPADSDKPMHLTVSGAINDIQRDTIRALLKRVRGAHMVDVKVRINGKDEWFQADWLWHTTENDDAR